MAEQAPSRAAGDEPSVELSAEDLQILIAALRLLLDAEDDRDTIARTKSLLGRLEDVRGPGARPG